MIIDTSILIEYSKGKLDIDDKILEKSYINSIIELEFIYGALNKKELKKINLILSKLNLLEIDQDILDLATKLMNSYVLSHKMSVYDSIIAASCIIYDLELWTLNKKDFRFLDIKLIQ